MIEFDINSPYSSQQLGSSSRGNSDLPDSTVVQNTSLTNDKSHNSIPAKVMPFQHALQEFNHTKSNRINNAGNNNILQKSQDSAV